MENEPINLRRILSANVKKHRGVLGLSQEKLAENARISTMMVKDIEGCRTWVSDKTLICLASALKTDIYRLFMPNTAFENEICRSMMNDLDNMAQRIRQKMDADLLNILKLWGKKS